MIQVATFKLKCVGCGMVENRPAHACHEMPFCACGVPMVLEQVTIKEKPMDLTKAVYLGDGLFAEFDGWQITLYASDGSNRTNQVYLEPGVLDNFYRYVAALKEAIQGGQPAVSAMPPVITINTVRF